MCIRDRGNSVAPLCFLAVSAVLNIVLDLWFVLGLHRGVAGAAEATVISQYVSGVGIAIYTWWKRPDLRVGRAHLRVRLSCIKQISNFSLLTCVQQSVMNLGILMVQGLVNSFGPGVMAAFAAAVKIDAFAYMPVQDFGNAFSTFIAQNYGAKKEAVSYTHLCHADPQGRRTGRAEGQDHLCTGHGRADCKMCIRDRCCAA